MSLINPNPDPVKHPAHYLNDRFGCECIDITRWMTFTAGNAFKYIWRHEDKKKPAEDLNKALQYLEWAHRDTFELDGERYHSTVGLESGIVVTNLMRDHVSPRLPALPPVYKALESIALWDDFAKAQYQISEALR